VLAKVTRDRIMVDLHAELPQYGFDAHKGYCTPVHEAALVAHGPSPVHRYSFVNVRAAVGGSSALVHNDGYSDDSVRDDSLRGDSFRDEEGGPGDDPPDMGGMQQ